MQITYLLGAGASANALPLVKANTVNGKLSLPKELLLFVRDNEKSLIKSNVGWDNAEIQDLLGICTNCVEFGTPDLYAKYLLETGDMERYEQLKSLLSYYFKYEQEVKKAFDRRALTFLTTISENRRIPDSIRIISWNYDYQIEIAAEKLKPVSGRSLQKIRNFTCWPNDRDGEQRYTTKPFLLHLNGVVGMVHSDSNFYDYVDGSFTLSLTKGQEHLVSFAWEDEDKSSKRLFLNQRIDVAREIAGDTEILVIIGYSFPFFNRKIDKVIIDAMRESLQKIYFQDPFIDGSQLKTQFDLSPKVSQNIEHITQVENYHIPYEF